MTRRVPLHVSHTASCGQRAATQTGILMLWVCETSTDEVGPLFCLTPFFKKCIQSIMSCLENVNCWIILRGACF